MLIAGVECGGTTFKVSIAGYDKVSKKLDRLETTIIDTTTPPETINKVVEWLQQKQEEHKKGDPIVSIGIASFGPVDLDKSSPTYGYITTTPKPNWHYADVVGGIKKAFPEVPIAFDTDVNAPAVAELASGHHGNVKSLAYITAGTGIGVGLSLDLRPVHGMMHPEGGHIPVPLAPQDVKDGFTQGTCPYHGCCLEGLANGIAIAKRKNISFGDIKNLEDADPVWDTVAHYYAVLCTNLFLIGSVEVIVLGGGIFQRKILYEKVRNATVKLLNGYVSKVSADTIKGQIKDSEFGADAGIMGAFYIAINNINKD
ncbi:fructokinase [Acrasis kona]|uniref:fructokinase n=1 Tax=Acrasis kona TaxID=1008807 RepID=A0AAW2YHI7_9EUKA